MAWFDKLLGRKAGPSKEDLLVDARSIDPAPFALALAADLSRQLAGSTVHDKTEQSSVEVRWKDADIPMRICLDLAFGSLGSLEIEALATGVQGEFNLHFEPDLTKPEDGEADAWDEEHRIFFAKSVFVTGTEAEARQAAAIVRGLGEALVDEIARAMEVAPAPRFWLSESRIGTAVSLFTIADHGVAALRLAPLVARVAAVIPRNQPATSEPAVRCSYCRGLWFPAPGRESCCHCGART